MERVSSKTVYEGQIFEVRSDTFRQADGSEREREIVDHPGAVTVVAHDEERFWMVRQPREAVGEDALLEIPAGKLDVEGEAPLECAQRELAEEIGKSAGEWRELKHFYLTPGWADEHMWLFEATELADTAEGEADPGERIEIVRWRLAELDAAIEQCSDAKSLIALLYLRNRLR